MSDKISRRKFIPLVGTALLGASCLSIRDEADFSPEIKRPKKLGKGSTIGICATAGPIRSEKEVDEFVELLESKGFRVKEGKNIRKQHGYFSAPDQHRAEEFMAMVEDPEVDGIFFTRGGWGCARVLEYLDFDKIKRNPKVIMGFSDMTTLLNAITHKTGLVTFHGPGGNSSWNSFSWRYIEDLLLERHRVNFKLPDAEFLSGYPKTLSPGEAEGILIGGNLTVISALVGSGYLPSWKDKILFLEDVMEEPYRIDRMLTHLKLNGAFDQIAGLILGTFRKCEPEEPHRSFSLEEVFEQHFSDLKIPVYYGAPIGHVKYKFTVPVGMPVRMDANNMKFEVLYTSVTD